METYPVPFNEEARLGAVRDHPGLTREPDGLFDAICDAVRTLFDCQVAHVSVLEDDSQWYKSVVGYPLEEMPKTLGFCSYTILSDEPFVIPDLRKDPRFVRHPMVVEGGPGARFYAGVPLVLSSGFRLGALCAIDVTPHERPTQAQLETLKHLAKAVVAGIERPPAAPAETDGFTGTDAFVALVGHELRTPLTVILGSLRILEMKQRDERDLRKVRAARKSAEHLWGLTESVIAFSSARTGELRLNEENVNLDAIISDVLAMHGPSAEDNDTFLWVLDSDLKGPVWVDAAQIKLALGALTLNAVCHGGQSMSISAGHDADGNIEIRVADDGTFTNGMALEELFRPFVVGNLENRAGHGGLGLGLPLTRKLIELHGGTLEVDTASKRSEAVIRLPRWRAEVADPSGLAAE